MESTQNENRTDTTQDDEARQSKQDDEDLFAELRPNMTRYSSIDLNDASVELEENERAASVAKPESERHSDSESQKKQPHGAAVSVNGGGSTNGAEENGKDHEESADGESYSDSGTIDGHEDDDLLFEEKPNEGSENEGDDEDEGMPVGSDEDGSVKVRQKVVQVDPKEQEDLDRELKALLQESLESRKSEVRPRATLNTNECPSGFKGPKGCGSPSVEKKLWMKRVVVLGVAARCVFRC